MDVFISFGILFLSMLISAFLMFIPGLFAIFTHHASGKYSQKKADDLELFFIIGAETFIIVLLFLIATIICATPLDIIILGNQILLWIMAGVFVALSIAAFFFYLHRGKTSQLFVPRKIVSKYSQKVSSAKTRSDAFMLGLTSGIPELPFTLPIYFISMLVISNVCLTSFPCAISIIIFAIITIIPLFIIHFTFKHNCNFASFLRFRIKNKTFFRVFISILYLLIAVLIAILGGYSS